MKIPNRFKVLQNRTDLIEIQSSCNYWKLLKNSYEPDTYFLYHKHLCNHDYHKQLDGAISFDAAMYYISRYEDFFCFPELYY